MRPLLDEAEARALGSLIEKDMSTPDYYPLSLNALINACNQKSNRDPVMHLDEDAVGRALDGLRDKELVRVTTEGRVPKYAHRASETLSLGNRELAILCVLLLRGQQTVGELRGRAQGLYSFDDLEAVEACLRRLMERAEPLVKKLPRQTGLKEPRYAHLLSGDVEAMENVPEVAAPQPSDRERIARLEAEVEDLKRQLAELQKQSLSRE